MKPEQFIREQGLKKAREVVDGAPDWAMGINCHSAIYFGGDKFCRGDVLLEDLKRLVESVDFINSVHGIDEAKELLREIDSEEWCYNLLTNVPIAVEYAPSDDLVIHYAPLKQAIRDHESIYGGGE